jgi:Fe-S-cluster containining protein
MLSAAADAARRSGRRVVALSGVPQRVDMAPSKSASRLIAVSLGCARCGDCCDPVKIDFGVWVRAVAQARRYSASDCSDDEDRQYWANAVFLASRCRPAGFSDGQVLLECANYDRAHSICRDYDNRPPLCSRFPWYDYEPGDLGICELRCSYLLDVPPAKRPEGARPLIPLIVVSR